MAKVTILRGPSGVGKSTEAAKMDSLHMVDRGFTMVVSADDWFTDESGVYRFDPKQLSEAHANCMRRFIDLLTNSHDDDLVIVDNTNTTIWEISPYVLVAQAFGIPFEIVTVNSPLSDEELAARNRHGVPARTIAAQRQRIMENPLPPWWKSTTVVST